MADEIDRANDQAELFLAAAIENNKAHRAVLKPTGQCLSCREPVPDGRRFCDADCRDDFDRISEARRRAGLG
jgi:hypothetical protein